MVTHVEHIVHQMKPFLTVQQFCPDTQAFEVVHQVDLNVNEPRLCLFHGFRLNAKRQILRLGQAVVALGKLAAQHGAVLRAHRIEMILLVRDAHHLLKIRGIRSHIHKRKLKADTQRAVPPASDNLLGTPAGACRIPCQREGHFRMSHTGAGFPSSLFY